MTRPTYRLLGFCLLCTLGSVLFPPDACAQTIERLLPPYPHLARPASRLDASHLVMTTADPFDKVVNYYLVVPGQAGWRRISPTAGELDAWRAANRKAKGGDKALVLILTKSKEKLKCRIEIGALRRASPPRQITIISVKIFDTRGFGP